MNDTVMALRKALAERLKLTHPRVYYEAASDKAVMPYLVFELPNSFDDGTMEQFVLDVDGWDEPVSGDTTALENMMAAADGVLQRAVILANGLAFIIYRDNRMTVDDDDKRIRRRKYIYQVRVYGGG